MEIVVPGIVMPVVILQAVLLLLAPIVVMIVLCVRRILEPKPMLFGVLAFFVSQIILRIPLMTLLQTQKWYQDFATSNQVLFLILVGGLSAGLFEESARAGGAALLKNRRGYHAAISFGLGHGLCEVVLLTGFSSLALLMNAVAAQNGGVELILSNMPQAEAQQTAQALNSQFAAIGVQSLCFAVFERICAVTFHVFATLLVFKSVRERKPLYYLLAILAHTVLNAGVSLLLGYVNIYVSYGYLLLLTVGALFHIIKSRPPKIV